MIKQKKTIDLSDLAIELGGAFDIAVDNDDQIMIDMIEQVTYLTADVLEQSISDFDRLGFLMAVSIATAKKDNN
jgi:hypothetical protein